MLMRVIDLTLPTVAENLALDEALLLEAEETLGSEVLRIWEWPTPAVVLGAGSKLAEDVIEETCHRDHVPILRRGRGGGTGLLGKVCLCFSGVLSLARNRTLHDIRASYRYIFDQLRDAFHDVLPGLAQAGTSDIIVSGLKFSGSAQQRKRYFILHHATILYDFDLSLVQQYLRQPVRQPAYRQGRQHADFLMNIPLKGETLRQRLGDSWGASTSSDWPEARVRGLVEKKYGNEEWIRKR